MVQGSRQVLGAGATGGQPGPCLGPSGEREGWEEVGLRLWVRPYTSCISTTGKCRPSELGLGPAVWFTKPPPQLILTFT